MNAGPVVAVRSERAADAEAVREVLAACFARSDGATPPEVELVDALRNAPAFDPRLSLVATVDGRVAGYLLFSTMTIVGRGEPVAALALAPLAVLKGHERLHLGTRLMRTGLANCRALGHRIVIVLGHPRYYARFGFIPARACGIEPPAPWPDEAFRVLELEPGASRGVTGVARYPAAFGIEADDDRSGA